MNEKRISNICNASIIKCKNGALKWIFLTFPCNDETTSFN